MLKLAGIGALGNMLSPAAIHLSRKNSPGCFVRIYDRNPLDQNRQLRRNDWNAHGAKLVSTYEELLTAEIEGVVICAGKNGDDCHIIASLIAYINKRYANKNKPFLLHCSTVSVKFVQAAFDACAQSSINYANYPLTGGIAGAKAGTMLIMASGNEQLFERLKPVLTCLGKPTYLDADVTAATKVKLLSHVLVFNSLLGVTSAVTVQRQSVHLSEMDTKELFDFLNQGAGGCRQWEVAIKQAIVDQEWQAGFQLPHAAIDAIYTADLLHQIKMPSFTIYPLLYIACVFAYIMRQGTLEVATQVLLKAMQASPTQVTQFLARYQDFSIETFLPNTLSALPVNLQEKVKLDINEMDFLSG